MAKLKVKDLLQKLAGKNVDFQTDMEVEESEVLDSNLSEKKIKKQKLSGVLVTKISGICFASTFKDGLLDGVSELYLNNGMVARRTYYKRGVRHGYSEVYNPDGTLRWLEYFENGIQIENKEN